MISFEHKSYTSVKVPDLKLAANQWYEVGKELDSEGKPVPVKLPSGEYRVWSKRTISVPLTQEELASLAVDLEPVEIRLGGKTYSVPQCVADYIDGFKLRHNQEMQEAVKQGSNGVRRGDALAFWSRLDMAAAMASVTSGMRSKDAAKAHNAKLDAIADALDRKDETAARAVVGL